jgi:acyl-CoA synthetase (AMP-forming)/AMP-acid ligase II
VNARDSAPDTPRPTSHGIASLADVRALELAQPSPLASHRSTYDLLARGAAVAPDAPALSFFVRPEDHERPSVWTHREWFSRISQAARLFRRLGMQRGDCVALVLPNLPETHWALWGAEAAGIAFPINAWLEPPMIAELLRASGARWVVTLAPEPGMDLWDKVARALESVPQVEAVLAVQARRHVPGAENALAPLPPRCGQVATLDFTREVERCEAEPLDEANRPGLDDVASYFCTGGTTGAPKIAVRTHRTEVANALQLAAVLGADLLGPGRTILCGLPLFHVNGQIGTGLAPWSAGGHVVLATPHGYRTPGLLQRFWDIAAQHRITAFSGVPTVYAALLQVPPAAQDLAALKVGICGAAPMPAELFHRFQRETGIRLLEGYGLTEAGCVSTVTPPFGEPRIGSIGVRLPWQRLRVVVLDEAGRFVRDAEADETGALAIQGDNLFRGYLNPEHERGLWIELPDERGAPSRWLDTGDLARVDADGYFWLAGRKKELIIRGGHNIDPKVIEEALHAHPAVALAAAVGRPDAHAGELPVAYAQLRPGASATPDELLAFAHEHIAERAAWPKHVTLLDALPTTAVGKVFKPALVLREIESVCREESEACGVTLTLCRARLDPKLGAVLSWAAKGDAAALVARLAAYTFRCERLAG